MTWLPCLSPHNLEEYRWSGRYPINELETLSRDIVSDQQEESGAQNKHLITVANNTDLVFASRFNAVTILRNVLATKDILKPMVDDGPDGRSNEDLLNKVIISPFLRENVTDVQMFEVKLGITSIRFAPTLGIVLVTTLYDIYKLCFTDGRYTIDHAFSSCEAILDAVGHGDNIYVLTNTTITLLNFDTINIEDIWRINNVSMARLLVHDDVFVIMEPTAVNLVSSESHIMAVTIPSQCLMYSDRFLDMKILQNNLCCVISTRHILIYDFQTNTLELRYSFLHFVNEARTAHISLDSELQYTASVVSQEKCSLFKLPDRFTNNFLTNFMIPSVVYKSRLIAKFILDNKEYLSVRSEYRKDVTDRIAVPVMDGLRISADSSFVLTENNDLLSCHVTPDAHSVWERWIQQMDNGSDKYEIKSYCTTLPVGELKRSLKFPKEVSSPVKDPSFDKIDDKYAASLIEAWEWT